MAKVFKKKTSENILKFLELVHRKLNIKMLITDGAKENTGDLIGSWVDKNKINHHITSAYHHCSNGRIERFNRTLGEGIKKQDKELRFSEKVEKVIACYNDTISNPIGVKPTDALLPEAWDQIKRAHFENRIEKYKKLFNTQVYRKLALNDLVLVEDPIHRQKGQSKFLEIGEVIGILNNYTYWIARKKKFTKMHITQLRKISKDDFYF
ncbi:Gag-Pol polyprotein [Nosema granulosis]|uniref:Gag-Pol polyprotein n=1 Tax=Nosema granulosis TaxID=83296 RepID=A0A9P6KZB8_9MICR|nr:Gag-Pol polyprotein [Nosema granulosis]